jgi:hypothetical protein
MVNDSGAVVRGDSLAVDFDDERLVANAGAVLTGTLIDRLGIERFVDRAVDGRNDIAHRSAQVSPEDARASFEAVLAVSQLAHELCYRAVGLEDVLEEDGAPAGGGRRSARRGRVGREDRRGQRGRPGLRGRRRGGNAERLVAAQHACHAVMNPTAPGNEHDAVRAYRCKVRSLALADVSTG